MPVMLKVWDREAEDGPAQVEMLSVKAKEAVQRDPGRYSFEEPDSKPARAPVAPAFGKGGKKGKHDEE